MAAGSARGQTQTSSLGAARPLPPSADIGPAVRWSSCAILISGLTGHGRRFAGDAWARPCVFRGPPLPDTGPEQSRSASRAGRPIVVPFGFCGTTVFRVFQEVTVAEGFFGERGGSATFIENQ